MFGIIILFVGLVTSAQLSKPIQSFSDGSIERIKCENSYGHIYRSHSEYRHHIENIRNEMHKQVLGISLDAYIVTSFDEHQIEAVEDSDKRIKYLSGFSSDRATIVITNYSLAFFTEEKYLSQANLELNCDWKIFNINEEPSLPEWILTQIPTDGIVGADPYTVPHYLWEKWQIKLKDKFIRLMKIHRNLVDHIWSGRPSVIASINEEPIFVHSTKYTGEMWQSKIHSLRSQMIAHRIDAFVVTSLTEIAYALNVRGNDYPYLPVFKAYLLITHDLILLYTNTSRVTPNVRASLRPACLDNPMECVTFKNYDQIWHDLSTMSHAWRRVLVPTHCVFDMGASEAIYSRIPEHLIVPKISPIIFMRAKKNEIEKNGMEIAHIVDGAAMCETLSYIEERQLAGYKYTEQTVANETDRSRRGQLKNKGISFKTIVSFGSHGSYPNVNSYFDSEITDESTLIIDSGGQYLDGTTKIARTIHFGEPTAEQKIAYTNVLRGIIQLSRLTFPENLKSSEVDALTRGPVWGSHHDYPESSGHGIGSFSSVFESPIDVAYTTKHSHTFKEGYFFVNEPSFYKNGDFGIRLANVLQVVKSNEQYPTRTKFLAFQDITLVPYQLKLIDTSLLSGLEKKWINNYNAKIREYVGGELKRQLNMQAFYWMMNNTRHIVEYYPESEFRLHNSKNCGNYLNVNFIIMIFMGILICGICF